MRILVPVFLLAVLLLPAQAPDPFRASVRLVNIAVTVRDARGNLVSGLSRDDFEVLDDGVVQNIAFFARSQDLPLSLALLVDASGSQEPFAKSHKHDIREFLEDVLRPRDQALLLCFANHLRLASDFSSKAHDIADSIGNCKGGGAPELGPDENRILGTAFYDALFYSTTLKLATAEGARKAIVVFSDGEDNSSAHHMLDAIESAQAENVVVFGIRYTEIKRGRMNARNRYGMRVMERISRETGGTDYDAGKTDMKVAFRAISEELRSAYELAYHPASPLTDGTFHKVVVRSKRPGLTVRTRTGYFAQ